MNRYQRLPARILLTMVLCCFLLVPVPGQAEPPNNKNTEATYKSLEVFANILSEIQKNYVEDIDPEQVIQGAIKGMLSSLDPHSSFMKPDDFKEMQVETKGSFSGIGVEITLKEGILTVVSPIEDTPAHKAGLKAGDVILKVDGEPTKDMSMMDAVKKLRGPKGSEVVLSIHRKGWTDLKEFTLTRDVIPLHSVRSRILDQGYAYARITNFQARTSKDLKEAIGTLSDKGQIKGLILDLRNNPGGLLDQSIKVSDLFLQEGVIVSTKGRLPEQNMEFKAHAGGTHFDFPLVVLVNEGSASASEIVAGALQDHGRALILGAQTFGKGSVQTIIPMSNGAGLRLTTARYYTPSGISIQAKGITPNILISSLPANDQEETDKPEAPRFLREKDLKHHLKNGDEEGGREKTPAPEQEAADSLQELKKDNQLYTALLILKSVSVFQGMDKRQ